MRRLKVFFDGGCRPNPGTMELAVVVAGRTTIVADAGHGTSTDAEWLALIEALTIVRALGAADYVLLGDSADVVAKANAPRSDRITGHRARFHALAAAGDRPRVRRIPRAQNLAGIALARTHGR